MKKILFLLVDILLLAYKIIRQIILPNKKSKGNILSGLYVFFIGTIERFFNFEHGSFNIAKVFRQKYIKQGLIIIGAFLFLLSSFEWAKNEKLINYKAANNSKQILSSVEKNKIFKTANEALKSYEN